MSPIPRKRRIAAALTTGFLALTSLAAIPFAAAETTSATLVGSLQSELGCAEDWMPACDATTMTAADDGIYELTVTVPAGDWEFKVALNKSWDESYGDGANNVPLSLAGATELTFTYNDETHALGLKPTSLPGAYTEADAALVAKPATHAGAGQQFYFVLTDRFANGSSANDTAGLGDDRLASGFDPTDIGFYHGGDLAGLKDKLDYIEGLGTTAIWLTPSLKNNPVQGEGNDASAGYHGYWITDFTQIDPHLGTNEEMKAFIDAAHARGIKVYFDIITNHTADLIDYEEGAYDYKDIASHPYKDADGNVVDVSKLAGKDGFPTFDPKTSFPYTPIRAADQPQMVPEWLNDGTLYHNRGNSTWEGESVTFGDFVGLDDLMTENPKVVDGMADIYRQWMDLGIDGFRIDTVKHVNFEFWTSFSSQLQRHADSTNPDFFTFGEAYDADAAKISPYMRKTDMSAVLDFTFQSRAVNYAKGLTSAGLSALFADDDRYTSPTSNASFLPTFLGNHDMGRVGHFLSGTDNAEARSKLAHSLMYLTRGQPVVYYGDEQGFVGNGGDKAARQSMFASKAEEYTSQNKLDGSPYGTGDHFDTSAALYGHIAALGELRDEHPALNTGAQIELFASDGPGLYAFARIDRDEKYEYVVALNNTNAPITQEIHTLTPGASYAAVYGASGSLTTNADGAASLTVPALGAVVYKAEKTVAAGDLKPVLNLSGDKLDAMAPIAVDTTDNRWAETSFAYRVVGSDDYTPLGVATGPDGRVFADTSALKKGSLVEYRAVTTDAAGNREAASGYGVVGVDLSGSAPEAPGGDDLFVTVPGSHNAAMGCPGDWQPDCEAAKLTKDENSSWYTATFDIPAGAYEYKVAIGGSWDENYGVGGERDGANLTYTAPGGKVTFYYDSVSHRAFTSLDGPLVTLPGSFNKALGCTGGDGGNWDPACLATLMTPGENGTYTFTTNAIPTGSHEVKVAHGLGWTENYGADGKPGGENITFSAQEGKNVTFTYDVATHVLTIEVTDPPAAGAGELRAQWIDTTTIVLPANLFGSVPAPDATVVLAHNATGGMSLADGEVAGTDVTVTPLSYVGALSEQQLAHFPHLKDYIAFSVTGMDRSQIEDALTGAVKVLISDDAPIAFTGVQIPGVLDDLYASDARAAGIGVTFDDGAPSVKLWAPTATKVSLQLWDDASGSGDPTSHAMTRNADGTWQVAGSPDWKNRAYRFEVTVYVPSEDAVVTNSVTDPYAVGLTAGSTHSVLLDLSDPALAPESWRTTEVPVVARAVDQAIYELHVRDFSIGDESVPDEMRGTYKAFTLPESDGVSHLKELAAAGVNSLHLLPTFDIATIPEPRSAQVAPQIPDAGPASEEQQAAIAAVADQDGFNWGYDPFHFFAPEGSYALDETAAGRVAEYREMVAAINGLGMRVIADEVFNHTAASGQAEKSVLDKVVPGYYHRLNAAGKVETSTCCQNVATEHQMAEQLMVDSVMTWARDYHVSGFRFDLMGHHSVANMLAVKEALATLTLDKDGIDGSTIHLYGEGWNFGEVSGNARFTQAIQGQLKDTGIATFSDRLRDAVHGGSPVDGDSYRDQGFGTGLYTDPNGAGRLQGDDKARADLLHQSDLVRLGLAGNLADYQLLASDGSVKPGKDFDYRGDPAGYAAQPDEVITYVDAHDNETLFDLSVIKLPEDTTMADRVRMNAVQLSTVALAQTPAFFHAGTDLMRSKSLDRDSYNSGDHFNAIDWRGIEHNFGVGLPPKDKNGEKWDVMRPLLQGPAKKASPEDLALSKAMALDLIKLRYASPLMRLGSAELIGEKVSFPNAGLDQTPGLILMHIDDTRGTDIDGDLDGVLIAINASPKPISEKVADLAGKDFALSAIQQDGADEVVKGTTWDAASGTLTIPARTSAVLHLAQEPGTSPTDQPTGEPTGEPTGQPTGEPTGQPTGEPTGEPTAAPSPSVPGEPGLPITGGQVGALAALALVALGMGAWLVARRRDRFVAHR